MTVETEVLTVNPESCRSGRSRSHAGGENHPSGMGGTSGVVHIFNAFVRWVLRLESETTAFSPVVLNHGHMLESPGEISKSKAENLN